MPTIYLSRLAQVGLKIEATPGTPESLAAADFSFNAKEISGKTLVPEVDRARTKPTLTPDAMLKKAKLVEIAATLEVVGKAVTTNESDALLAHRVFMAAGLANRVAVKMITIGSITGGTAADMLAGKRIGDNATEGSATKTGVIVAAAAGKVWYIPGTGTFATTDTLRVYDSPAMSASITANPVTKGYVFKPLTEQPSAPLPSLTAAVVDAGQIHELCGGAADFTLNLDWNGPAGLQTRIRGPMVPDASDASTPATSDPIASVAAVGGVPALAVGQAGHINRVPMVITKFTVALGNTIADRRAMAAGGLQGSGYAASRITGRKITITTDPEKPDVGTENLAKKLIGGATFPVAAQLGDPADANGALIVYAPALQMSGDYAEEDRDGIKVVPINGMASGTADDELWIAHVST